MRYRVRDMKTYTHSNLLEHGYKCIETLGNRQYRKAINKNTFIVINFEDNKGVFLFIVHPVPIHKYAKYVKDEATRLVIEDSIEWLVANDIIYRAIV